MARDTVVPYRIALLATGDEICQGDIVNTNSPEIAQRLIRAGMEPWLHALAPDVIADIESTMRFLLGSHQALITTGGLGPTSDDLTRFALGKVAGKELVFDDSTWQEICRRLQTFGYATPPESNRQQAMFPAGATIIPNKNGTAAGCYIKIGEQFIFMLPGPPMECLPMVDEVVLPVLRQAGFEHTTYRKKWLLFGVSEGKIAEELDQLAAPYDCVTGYRLWYPYIEFKLHCTQLTDFTAVCALVEKAIKPYLFADGQQAASLMLQQQLCTPGLFLQISDHATGGALQHALKIPENYLQVRYTDAIDTSRPFVTIQGLADYWEEKLNTNKTALTLHFPDYEIALEVPYRGKRVLQYAVEVAAHHISEYLANLLKV